MNGYTGEALANYHPAYVSMSKQFQYFRANDLFVEVTLLTGRVIVRQVANLRRDKVILKSKDDVFGRIHVPFSMVMTIGEPVHRVDTDFNQTTEYVDPGQPREPHLDFSKVLSSIYTGKQRCVAELITGHRIYGTVIATDRERVILKKEEQISIFISYTGLRAVTGFQSK